MYEIFTNEHCSPCRGITISGTGSVQEDDAQRGRILEESRVVALVFILYNMYYNFKF